MIPKEIGYFKKIRFLLSGHTLSDMTTHERNRTFFKNPISLHDKLYIRACLKISKAICF
ncbi:Uncharacterized protein dnm_086610 [Desulfonema magnum]|uniref:Uncharacterized protein n=1 Tax=Desulfonema magnum TaxID=45655 RepID=A0A975GTX3_9BACT|nr:Uncharacterized protein dnm_086610 [Desulfonema magnum]